MRIHLLVNNSHREVVLAADKEAGAQNKTAYSLEQKN